MSGSTRRILELERAGSASGGLRFARNPRDLPLTFEWLGTPFRLHGSSHCITPHGICTVSFTAHTAAVRLTYISSAPSLSSAEVFSPSQGPPPLPTFDPALRRNRPLYTSESCRMYRGPETLTPQRSQALCTMTRRPISQGLSSPRCSTVCPPYTPDHPCPFHLFGCPRDCRYTVL